MTHIYKAKVITFAREEDALDVIWDPAISVSLAAQSVCVTVRLGPTSERREGGVAPVRYLACWAQMTPHLLPELSQLGLTSSRYHVL